MKTNNEHHHPATYNNHYRKLLIMGVFSFMAMYGLMYSMVDSSANIFHNVNQFYMAALMTAAMILIEIAVMGKMYVSRKLNIIIVVASIVVLVMSFFFIRKQTGVSDKQFLKSMIPHHAAAVLMVNETTLTDPEIKKLANDIIMAQEKEIEFMKAKLEQIEKNK